MKKIIPAITVISSVGSALFLGGCTHTETPSQQSPSSSLYIKEQQSQNKTQEKNTPARSSHAS